MQKTEYNDILDLLEDYDRHDLSENLHQVPAEKLEAVSSMVKAMKADHKSRIDIGAAVVEDITGFQEDRVNWKPNCSKYIINYSRLDQE